MPGFAPLATITFPLGVFFFSLKGVSYLMDVYFGVIPGAKSPIMVHAYVAFFPELVAGPVSRYGSMAVPHSGRSHSPELFLKGFSAFALAVGMKTLIADPCLRVADQVWGGTSPNLMASWVGILAFALGFYFAFNAYCLVAWGFGQMLGFDLPRNFNAPYHARSLTEFWKRWNMSVSTWFRDYIFIPMGGNARGPFFALINISFMTLAWSLWYMAGTRFILWGMGMGVILFLEKIHHDRGRKNIFQFAIPGMHRLFTLLYIAAGWVLFRSPDLAAALKYFQGLAGGNGIGGRATLSLFPTASLVVVVVAAGLAIQPRQALDLVTSGRRRVYAVSILVLAAAIFQLVRA